MKRFLTSLSISALLGMSMISQAQDIHFSQFYENSILRNPALTGIFSGDYKFGADYRSQWGSVSTPYSTVMMSGETRILVDRAIGDYISFGMVVTYDKAGTISFTSTQLYPSISYNKALEDRHNSYLSVGLTGGYINRSVDQSKMTFSSQYINGNYDPGNPTGEIAPFKTLNNYDIGAGVSLNSSLDESGIFNYYIGAGAFHLNAPTETFNGSDVLVKLPVRWDFNAGFHTAFSAQFGFTGHFDYDMMLPYQEMIFGGMFTYRAVPIGLPSVFGLSLGVMYRYQDAVIPVVKIDYKDVSFGFSYDITTSSLVTGNSAVSGAGATEISLYVRGNYNHKKNPRDAVMCPRFEDLNNYNFR